MPWVPDRRISNRLLDFNPLAATHPSRVLSNGTTSAIGDYSHRQPECGRVIEEVRRPGLARALRYPLKERSATGLDIPGFGAPCEIVFTDEVGSLLPRSLN